jgi:NAD(P)-dependent dehydrogenase (short-subunit alcohol dehydrogenase family)
MTSPGWTAADLPSFAGRTVVVTGANSGLGLVTSRELARVGARVVMAVRDTERGEKAAATVPGLREVRRLDLADLASVREFAAAWEGNLDVLINNAGVMAVPAARTADGFEMQFGTNHLGHFALTNLLLPHVSDRVVTISSSLHRRGRIRFEDPNWQTGKYDAWAAYSQSKLANLLFVLELQRRLAQAGSSVRAFAAHPGYASTNLQSHSGGRLSGIGMRIGNLLFAQSDANGALSTLFAASQDLPDAGYVGPDGRSEMKGHPTLVGRTAAASDAEAAKRLWVLSEQLTGVTFGLGQLSA